MNIENELPVRIRIEYMEDMPNGGIQAFPDENGKYVFHADYKALEADHAELRIAYDAEYNRSRSLEKELAALKAKVGELVAADNEYDENSHRAVWPKGIRERRQAALEALK